MTEPAKPPRIAALPTFRVMGKDRPVPWFVCWFKDGEPCKPGEGEPDFRIVSASKVPFAIRHERCWVCGQKLGAYRAYLLGPMCTINRVTSEPPSHHDCALYSVQACPHLLNPNMKRNEKDLPPEADGPGGLMIKANPGVTAMWITKQPPEPFTPPGGGRLIKIGDPASVLWFREGRAATRDEVMAAFERGYPRLLDLAKEQGDAAVKQLQHLRGAALQWVGPE